ncbi:MAG: DUF1501 domain-containing protein, partial [Pirellulales bacterium]
MNKWELAIQSRRGFLTSTAGGIGGAALASLLAGDLPAGEPRQRPLADLPAGEDGPFAPRPPHFRASATHCIFIYLYGGISQLDLFDPKPKLAELDGQPLPESLAANVRFAFVKKDTARFLASPRKFSRHGQCGMEISELLPHLAGCADEIALVRSMHTEA